MYLLFLKTQKIIAIPLGGTTIHTGLQFNIASDGKTYLPLSDENLALFRAEYQDVDVYIVDEMSFIGPDFFYAISKRLGKYKKNRFGLKLFLKNQ